MWGCRNRWLYWRKLSKTLPRSHMVLPPQVNVIVNLIVQILGNIHVKILLYNEDIHIVKRKVLKEYLLVNLIIETSQSKC